MNNELIKKIRDSYFNGEYEQALNQIDELNKLNIGIINEKILHISIECKINLKKYDEAMEDLRKIQIQYPNFYNNFQLIKKYIRCFYIENALELINNSKLTEYQYFNIAKKFLLYGELVLANKYFNYCILKSDNEYIIKECKTYINRIKTHINTGEFIEQSYEYFKTLNNELEVGHIVYGLVLDKKYIKKDPVHDKRPYLIWKIDGDDLYCFPVTKNLKTYSYTLYEQDYLNFDSDRRIKDYIVHMKKYNVDKIYEKLNEKDLSQVLKKIYVYVQGFKKEERINRLEFIDEYVKNMSIKKGNVIILYNKEKDLKRYYFVIDIDEKNDRYETIELSYCFDNKDFNVLNYEIINIKKTNAVYFVFNLSDYRYEKIKEEILNEQSVNQKIKKLF